MTIDERRTVIKARVDALSDEGQLEKVEFVLDEVGGYRTAYELSDERYDELMRRAEVVFDGGGVPHDEVMRRYGINE